MTLPPLCNSHQHEKTEAREVRAKRLAGVRNSQLFLGNGGAAASPTPAASPLAETLGSLAPRSPSLSHGWPPQTHQKHPPSPPQSSGTSAGGGSAAASSGAGALSGNLRFCRLYSLGAKDIGTARVPQEARPIGQTL